MGMPKYSSWPVLAPAQLLLCSSPNGARARLKQQFYGKRMSSYNDAATLGRFDQPGSAQMAGCPASTSGIWTIRDGDNAILDINGDYKAFIIVTSKG